MTEKSKEQLEFARFLAQIGHEIRTPLNAIKGFGDLLVEERVGELNPVQKKYLGKMTDSAQIKFWIGPRWNPIKLRCNIRNWICAGLL